MINKTVALLLSFFICFSSVSQNTQEIDSLKAVLDTLQDDMNKAAIVRRLHELTMFSDPDLARSYAVQGMRLSEKIGDKRGIAIGYMQIGNYFINRNSATTGL